MIFVLQLGVGVASYILRTEVEDFLHTNMLHSMHNYNHSHPGVYKTWNVIQHEVGHGSFTITVCVKIMVGVFIITVLYSVP